MPRERYRTEPFPSGGFSIRVSGGVPIQGGPTFTSGARAKTWKRCVDETGKGTDHPLLIELDDRSGLRPLNGEFGVVGSSDFRQYVEYYGGLWVNLVDTHLAISLPSLQNSATTLLARTNPSRADVGLLNFIYELKDLPGMLRDIGDFKLNKKRVIRSPRDLANHNLSLQMGWIPLISDITKLLHFTSSVDKRVDELKRLYSNEGLKRRITLANESTSGVISTTIESNLSHLINVNRHKITHVKRWGTVRWLPTVLPAIPVESEQMRRFAMSLVLGSRIDAEFLWNAIPWTWLVDWATNTGEYIRAHSNHVPCVATKVNIMTQTTTTTVWKRTDSRTYYKGGDGITLLSTKERAQPVANLSGTLPFLNARRLSILGSLALQRLGRRR
ncbi:MAG: putative maturation protein [Alehxovirus faecicola]|uniref:Maturation protein n=1 Tax=Leviviridae sp. TaxID=2027243 RepID=A0ABY3SSQ5_9VIRU|nr:MAG: putative maturation protein [Leviviridae sp.]